MIHCCFAPTRWPPPMAPSVCHQLIAQIPPATQRDFTSCCTSRPTQPFFTPFPHPQSSHTHPWNPHFHTSTLEPCRKEAAARAVAAVKEAAVAGALAPVKDEVPETLAAGHPPLETAAAEGVPTTRLVDTLEACHAACASSTCMRTVRRRAKTVALRSVLENS